MWMASGNHELISVYYACQCHDLVLLNVWKYSRKVEYGWSLNVMTLWQQQVSVGFRICVKEGATQC